MKPKGGSARSLLSFVLPFVPEHCSEHHGRSQEGKVSYKCPSRRLTRIKPDQTDGTKERQAEGSGKSNTAAWAGAPAGLCGNPSGNAVLRPQDINLMRPNGANEVKRQSHGPEQENLRGISHRKIARNRSTF